MHQGPSFLKKLEAVPLPQRAKRPVSALLVMIQDFLRCDLPKQASAMAYVTLLSLIPSLVAIFCVLSLFSPMMGKGNMLQTVREFVLSNLAASSGQQAVSYLDKMIGGLDLKKIGWQSFASVLVTLVMLLRQIEEALNRIWLVRKGRNIFTRFMYFWTFLTLGTVVIAIIVGVSSGFNVKQYLKLGAEVTQASGGRFGFVTTWAGSFVFFAFLYKFVPNCLVEAKPAAVGAAASSTILLIAGYFYGLFVRDSKNYQTLYGAIAQLPIFLLWLYICWTIILLGALIAWRMQEGFPESEEEDTLDAAGTPAEALRNVQVKSMLPTVLLLAIYRNFQEGTGRGMGAQELAHAVKLPLSWVSEALDVLEEMGYVIVSKTQIAPLESDATVLDPYYPALPADKLTMPRLMGDLGRPVAEWMAHWQYELPLDLPRALQILNSPTAGVGRELTVAQVLEMAPWRPPEALPIKA